MYISLAKMESVEDGEIPVGDSLKMCCMLATTQHFLLIVKF